MKTNLPKLVVALVGVLAASTMASDTKVYRCVQGELVIFSQIPCEHQAEQVTIKSSQGTPDSKATEQLKQQTQTIARYLEQQDKDRQLAKHYRNIERYKSQMKQEFAQMQQTRYRTEADKRNAVERLTRKYDALIGKEHEAIKVLSKKAQQQQ